MTERTRSESDRQPPSSAEADTGAPRKGVSRQAKRLIAGAVVLALLLIFILENTQDVKVSYFGAGGHLPLGVALLIAAFAGALLLGLASVLRGMQGRRRARRQR
jgi:uncharacterized integral membrane protein